MREAKELIHLVVKFVEYQTVGGDHDDKAQHYSVTVHKHEVVVHYSCEYASLLKPSS
jgi:ADP-ribose pyrophosphatase YjhB (NUDIX family)